MTQRDSSITEYPTTNVPMMEACAGGQAIAWEAFVGLYSDVIYRKCVKACRRSGSRLNTVEDLVQNVIVYSYGNLWRYFVECPELRVLDADGLEMMTEEGTAVVRRRPFREWWSNQLQRYFEKLRKKKTDALSHAYCDTLIEEFSASSALGWDDPDVLAEANRQKREIVRQQCSADEYRMLELRGLGWTHEQIAIEFEMTPAAVRKRLSRVAQRCRAELKLRQLADEIDEVVFVF